MTTQGMPFTGTAEQILREWPTPEELRNRLAGARVEKGRAEGPSIGRARVLAAE